MTTTEITNGLIQLGFNSGWVVSGDEIILWENAEPQPTMAEISEAAKLYETTKAAEKQAILDKLGLTADEIATLLG